MPREFKNEKMDTTGGRVRRRLHGMMTSKTGKTAGVASLVVPLLGLIMKDLQKPNSVIRSLVGRGIDRLLESRRRKIEAIDITDEVEIIDD